MSAAKRKRTSRYSPRRREDAFVIYAGCRNYNMTARIMRERFPKDCKRITPQRIKDFYVKGDWRERLLATDKKIQNRTEENIIGMRSQLIEDLRNIYDKIVIDAQEKTLKPKSVEGAVNALTNISKLILELTGERNKIAADFQFQQTVNFIFMTLAKDETLGPLLLERQQALKSLLQQEMDVKQSGGRQHP
ncbi:MAG: hypothetical protein ACE5IR_08315 [bacterium]